MTDDDAPDPTPSLAARLDVLADGMDGFPNIRPSPAAPALVRRAAEAVRELTAACEFWIGQCDCDGGFEEVMRFDEGIGLAVDYRRPCRCCAATRAAVAKAKGEE